MRKALARKGGALVVAALLLGFGAAGVAQAQQAVNFPFKVTENRVPGAAGQATFTPMGNNQVKVDIRITGMPANQERAAHIHTAQGARCDTNSPVTYPLTNVKVDGAGVGTSSTTITLTADKPVNANNAYVNVHQNNVAGGAGGGPGPGAICADVTTSFTAQGAGAAPAQGGAAPAAPRTGTGIGSDAASRGWLFGGLAALVVLAGGAGALAYARRR